MWRKSLSDVLQMPLINADRLTMSILPEVPDPRQLPSWAAELRDSDPLWLRVTQQGVASFVGHAMAAKVPFAMETVFSHERNLGDGRVETKIDLIRDMQTAGYFVLLFFVGLTNADLSVLRVQTRVLEGGHGIPEPRLRERFPRTQRIVGQASIVADATIMADNSRGRKKLSPSAESNSKKSRSTTCARKRRARQRRSGSGWIEWLPWRPCGSARPLKFGARKGRRSRGNP